MLAESISPDPISAKENSVEFKKIDGEDKKSLKKSGSALNFKKLVPKALGGSSMKHMFKSKKPRLPVDVVRQTRASLLYFQSSSDGDTRKRFYKVKELDVLLGEMKSILYGNGESEPAPEGCAQLTKEFFRDDTMRLLILCLPELNFEETSRQEDELFEADKGQVVKDIEELKSTTPVLSSGELCEPVEA